MKKVLFITSNDWVPWGGSEQLWYELALMFLENKYEVAVSIKDWKPEPAHVTKLQQAGATLLLRPAFSTRSIFARLVKKLSPGSFETNNKLNHFKPDFVLVSQGANVDGLDWILYYQRQSIPCFTIVQAVTESFWPTTETAAKMRDAYTYCRASYFVSKANLVLTEVQAVANFPHAKVIFNPFNVAYDSNISYPSLVEGKLHLANVARFELQAKGQDILFQVMSDPKWRSRDVVINLYGKGMHAEAINGMIRLFGTNNIVNNGFVKTEDIWKTNQALILPSRFEGLPLALVEAMLCGRFGIVTNVSGNTEVITDNENGFVAAAPKPEYLDEALERAWLRREEWKTIGEKAKAHIKGIVPPEPVSNLYDDIIEKVKQS